MLLRYEAYQLLAEVLDARCALLQAQERYDRLYHQLSEAIHQQFPLQPTEKGN